MFREISAYTPIIREHLTTQGFHGAGDAHHDAHSKDSADGRPHDPGRQVLAGQLTHGNHAHRRGQAPEDGEDGEVTRQLEQPGHQASDVLCLAFLYTGNDLLKTTTQHRWQVAKCVLSRSL